MATGSQPGVYTTIYLKNHCQTHIPKTLLSSCLSISVYKFSGRLGCNELSFLSYQLQVAEQEFQLA